MISRITKIFKSMCKKENGAVNIAGTMMLGIGMVFLAVGFIMFPIATTATQSILDYSYSGNVSITDATFTGLTQVAGIVPLLILLGFISAAVITGMMGVKAMKGAGEARATPGGLMMMGLSIVFVAVGLIIFPVVLDGVASVYNTSGVSSFTGLPPLLLVTPMIVLLAFISASVITGFFGVKSLKG